MPLTRRVGGLLVVGLALIAGCSDKDDDDGPLGSNALDGSVGSIDSGLPVGDAQVASDAGRSMDAAVAFVTSPKTSFFVTSQTSMTGNLGGLAGADARCQALASAVGLGAKTWHAFLSVEHDPANGNMPTEARTRIGTGPWYNAKGNLLASDLAALFALTGNADVFIDEHGNKINGQWTGSPAPVEHDILTGTASDGGVAVGQTCSDWTSAGPAPSVAVVGHADGLGPMQNASPPYNSWFSSHPNGGCDNTAPLGGAGRLYCFATN
ncbi:MAG: hypothetical protein JWN48_2703 [Myxococcaceae bacterium]|nr:hypothetical protein [Myxococcaceae bacterium]